MIRNDKPKQDIAKFKEVLEYVLNKIGKKSDMDEVSINNLMYFIDFDFYEKCEERLTGIIYRKNGSNIINDSIKKEIISQQIAKLNDNTDRKKKPGSLTKIEEKHINDTLSRVLSKNVVNVEGKEGKSTNVINCNVDCTTQIEKSSIAKLIREDVPYLATAEGNEIPYESVFYRTDKTSVRSY